MGLLRAVADAVIVGSGTLAADSQQVWTPEGICPDFAPEYGQLRKALGKSGTTLNAVVSGSNDLAGDSNMRSIKSKDCATPSAGTGEKIRA